MKILIVDDTNTDRLLLKMYLLKLGHQVVEAVDGEQAIIQYIKDANELDLILMDVQMPELGGFEAVNKIRSIQESRNLEWVPIIFLSASAEADDIEEGIRAGGDDYLIKPIHQKVLSAKMLAMQRIADMRHRLILANNVLEAQASTDHLTGILNRRALETVLDREVARSKRFASSFSFALFDLDHFKRVNDEHGHDAGDYVLAEVVKRVSEGLRSDDALGRVGGEEFGVLIVNCVGKTAKEACERYRQLISEKPFYYNDIEMNITISVGCVTFNVKEDSRESIYKKADVCLYEAKRLGRNQVVYKESS
ncbi:GGDEF domain-containing response regulator [Marinomonas pollencensis]|uniref:diguanylate cyclase n=1 Tax=Marinomonas pollencensis TaxID=491954 RepID=A0A3E0DJ36_9GAMM|nr:diguanylate cyclase [Marinomonas pollencensis]REG81832.1 response regulator receiver modulated diguanylate cyclase [Marinomonas pollencensis]